MPLKDEMDARMKLVSEQLVKKQEQLDATICENYALQARLRVSRSLHGYSDIFFGYSLIRRFLAFIFMFPPNSFYPWFGIECGAARGRIGQPSE